MTTLSNVRPDFEGLVEQLRADLQNRDTWKDLYRSATGQTLIEYNAAVGTMLHYALERAIQEAFMITANIPTSIYSNSRMLGVNPNRKTSARTRAQLSLQKVYNRSVVIPELSSFDISGTSFYNPNTIVFPTGVTQISNIELEQGEIVRETYTGSGQEFQELEFSENFEANQNLMRVIIDSVVYTREFNALWNLSSGTTAFLEQTLPDGSVRLVFGNNEFATIPSSNTSIDVSYAKSLGSEANTSLTNLTTSLITTIPVPSDDNAQVTGETTSAIENGSDEESPDNVKYSSPRIFAAAGRAIRRDDWKAISLKYPGLPLADANAVGEYELNSIANTLMNRVSLILLPRDINKNSLTSSEKTDFQNYIKDFKHVTTLVNIVDPVVVNVNVTANVYYFNGFTPSAIENEVRAVINEFFERKLGSLNKDIYISDLLCVINDVEGVDYTVLSSPSSQVVVNYNQFARLNNLTLNILLSSRT